MTIATESTSTSPGASADPYRPVVLVVDDDPKNLVALESILDDGTFRLIKAQTGNQALLALMADDFAVVVLDVQMPDMSGIELARLIKQRRRTQHIPIIFLTAHYREDEHAILGYDVGAVDYLTKPVNPMVLKSKVNVFVDLFRKTQALARMNVAAQAAEEALRVANAELEARNAALEREAEERRRRIRAESAQAEAEAANAAKDRFLAMLSHELRTPLSPIIHAVTLLAENDCPPHLRDAVETIHRNVRLEARLIDDLLDLARVRNDKLHLKFQSVEVHDVLRQAIDICRPDIAGRKLTLVEELNAHGTHVLGDAGRLQQIFWNLLSNAAKFTASGGTITVHTSGPDLAKYITVEISDNGAGIAPEKIRRIFNAFEQAESPTPTGLGLGLAICKALVERHRGTIEARSDGVGKGASFRIRLPTVQPTVKAKPSEPVAMPDQSGLRLLVVDDHRDTLETLQLLLKRRGYAVRTAGSIAQALQVAEDYEFDMLVSDIGLPDGRGTDLLRRLEKRSRHPFLAIAMSGFGTDEDLRSSHHAGFAQHLTKPVEFDILHEAIARLSSNLPKALDE